MARAGQPALLLLPLATICAVAIGHAATPTKACSDPCLVAARTAFKECASSANGAFLDAIDGCLERDHECVEACRWTRRECRDGTGIGAEIANCNLQQSVETGRCRERFPLVPKKSRRKREDCIDRAQAAGFQCRSGARRAFRGAVRACRQDFTQCTQACGAGGPPGGTGGCKSEAKAAVQTYLANCKLTFRTTSSGCIDKDVTCVQDCGDVRVACEGPTRTMLDAAIAACRATLNAAVAACAAANPAGSPAFEQCITAAQATASTCVDAALDAAAPGLAACVGPYVTCVAACPPPA